MKIAVDFDNTIVNTFEVSKKYLDIYLPGNKMKSYHELTPVQEKDFFNQYAVSITENLHLFKNVKKTFQFCHKHGITLIMVSKRGWNCPALIPKTLEFLEKNGVEFDEINQAVIDKGKFCKLNNVDLLIDDLDKELKKVEDYGIRVLKYGSKSDKYNYALSWDEVYRFIQKGL